MRSDMHRLLVERPRFFGPGRRRMGRKPCDPEDHDAHESMRHNYIHGWGARKSLNDNLAPLRRYLMKQVGRPWSKVYSELCAGPRSAMHQDHLRQHMRDYVSLDPKQGRFLYVDRAGILRRRKSKTS